MGSIAGIGRRRKRKVMAPVEVVDRKDYEEMELDSRLALIQALIPLGLSAVSEELQREVAERAGPRHGRKEAGQPSRYGTNPGSVRLAEQMIPIRVPRLRDDKGEVALDSYRRLHLGEQSDETMFRKVLYGISCRNYEAAAEAVPGAIGLSKSSVSRHFVRASAKLLKEFEQRDLSELDVVVLFIDGKTFSDDEMVVALAVDIDGHKTPIGFVQTDTENKVAIADFLRSLLSRGLGISKGLFVVIDGAKGLRAGVKAAFRKRCVVQRCQWHKRENVVSYLPKSERRRWRRLLQRAYQQPDYVDAKAQLIALVGELEETNPSAAASLREGLEETLTLHRLGLFTQLGRSLKTTNCIESVSSLAEQRCGKVDRWTNSKQKHRWLAAALVDIEPRLNRIMGYRHLTKLRHVIMEDLNLSSDAAALAA